MNSVVSFFEGLTSSIDIQIEINLKEDQKFIDVKLSKGITSTLPVFTGADDLIGTVVVTPPNSDKFEHLGIKCYLIGFLEIYSNSDLSTEFVSLSKQLEPAGAITGRKVYKFKFSNFEKEYDTFNGIAGRVKYYLKVAIQRNYLPPLVEEQNFAVLQSSKQINAALSATPLLIALGVDTRLHIQFTCNKSCYHLKDVILGRVCFNVVKIPIIRMELSIVCRETFGTGSTSKTESRTLATYEIMDGCPITDSSISIRLYLKGVKHIGPSYSNIHNRMSVKHWINLMIFDEQKRKYFKQMEVILYRK